MTTELYRLDRLEHGVARLSLSNGGGNALSPAMLRGMQEALDHLEADVPRSLLIDGGHAKLFSGGFSLPDIIDFDRPRLVTFFDRFMDVMERLVLLPCPTIIAVHSHAIAGGCILAMTGDLRVVQTTSKLRIGLNEVDLGVALPASAQVMLAARTTTQHAHRLAMSGALMSPDEAYRTGWADELALDAQARGLQLAIAFASKPGEGARVTKLTAAVPLASAMRRANAENLETFVNEWFSESAQETLRGLADKLAR